MTLFLHLARRVLLAFAAAIAAAIALVLAVDAAENVHRLRAAAELLRLLACEAAIVAHQTAPAAVLLAAAVVASGLRRTREYTALRALGLGPWRIAAPALAAAAAVAAGVFWLGDRVVPPAAARAQALLAGGARRTDPAAPARRWFRDGDGRLVCAAAAPAGPGLAQVTILELTPAFRLRRRIDAARLAPDAGGAWALADGVERTFGEDGAVAAHAFARRPWPSVEAPAALAASPAPPAQLARRALVEEAALRARLGLPARAHALEAQRRIAYPLAVVPAALLAVGIALRPRRRGHLAASILEALAVSALLWAAQSACGALALAGRAGPTAAAWTPTALLAVAGLVALRRAR